MPNTKIVRSCRQSGTNMQKMEEVNTTYTHRCGLEGQCDHDFEHEEEMGSSEHLPSEPTPLKSVDLGPVKRKSK